MNILDIIFPPVCIGCNRLGSSICKSCLQEFQPTVVDVCPYCYQPSQWGRTHDRCSHHYGLDGAISILRYNTLAKKLIKRLKYARAWQVMHDVSKKTPQHWWRIHPYIDHIATESPCKNLFYQSIPLHTARERMRGFNQSDILLQIFQNFQMLESIHGVVRCKNTLPQAKQPGRADRISNIKNAFTVIHTESIINNTVILVDDLFTSGSTAKECARVLKTAGAYHVYLLTLAHGR